jgi:hypothetical protein
VAQAANCLAHIISLLNYTISCPANSRPPRVKISPDLLHEPLNGHLGYAIKNIAAQGRIVPLFVVLSKTL